MKVIGEQNSQDFYKFDDFKTIKLLLFGEKLLLLFYLNFQLLNGYCFCSHRNKINLNIIFNLLKFSLARGHIWLSLVLQKSQAFLYH